MNVDDKGSYAQCGRNGDDKGSYAQCGRDVLKVSCNKIGEKRSISGTIKLYHV